MIKPITFTASILFALLLNTLSSLASIAAEPDAHAPIGVMRDHIHNKDDWMLSYRIGYMHMDGNRDGLSPVSTQAVHEDYKVAPTDMPMRMHMIGAMFGVTDNLTLAVMGGYADMTMGHIRRDGSTFSMENAGVTDTKVNALYELYNDDRHRIQVNTGVSLPTGSISDRKPNDAIFAYPMQLGSGTYDFLPGIHYSMMADRWSLGSQVNATLRGGENSRGYTLGNRYNVTAWSARKLSDAVSVSLRLDATAWETVKGTDDELSNPMMFMAPPMDANLQAGERVDLLVGINIIALSGALKDHRVAAEFGMPIHQRLTGPRLETDYRLTVGWQRAF